MNYNLHEHAIGSTLETGATFVNTQLNRVKYSKIRKYFDVDDNYVFEKLKLIYYPFGYDLRKASVKGSIYNPDLYIPLMSILTLGIINSFYFSSYSKFSPDGIFVFFTRVIFFKLFLGLIYKFIGYLFGLDMSFFDLFAICGYKYFTIIPIRIVSKNFFLKAILSIYTVITFFIFISRTLKNLLIEGNLFKKNIYVLFCIVLSELLFLVLMICK